MNKFRNRLGLRGYLILGVLFCIFMIKPLIVEANESKINSEMAVILSELGLLKGTDQGYDLENEASRNQSAVMLVRYLGIEDFVIKAYEQGELTHPFIDVPLWASPHVAYLYQSGLTYGFSSYKYGGIKAITGNEYATMILRMLGYDDSQNDFQWSSALEFLIDQFSIGEESINELKYVKDSGITRGQMVRLSYLSLYFDYKSVNHNVIDSLYYNEVISADKYEKYKSDEEYTYDETKGIWISYLDLRPIIQNKSAYEFRKEMKEMLNNITNVGMNTIFIQVRPFSDALYESVIYEWSHIMTGTDGATLGFDPLDIIIKEAKEKNIRVEAWINPYRIRNDIIKEPLNPEGKISKMIENNSNITIQMGNQLMFNPASDLVQALIVSGVAEIVKNYDVDGIHFDDYFYPSNDLSLDLVQYEEYLSIGGTLAHAEFRRERIDLLIKDVYSTIKSLDSDVSFGVSPQGSTINNFEHTFIDVEKWINNIGYIDYICPQIYYGFDNETLDFSKVLKEWSEMLKDSHVDLYIGLAAYKIGLVDNWAGTGNEEWITKEHRLKYMIEASRSANNYKGIALFRYDSLFNTSNNVSSQVYKELEEIRGLFLIKEE